MEPIADPPGGGAMAPVFHPRFQHSSALRRPRAVPLSVSCVACNLRADMIGRRAIRVNPTAKKRCPMTSIADPLAGPPVAETEVRAKGEAAEAKAASVAAPAITLPAAGERELRLDLFRG